MPGEESSRRLDTYFEDGVLESRTEEVETTRAVELARSRSSTPRLGLVVLNLEALVQRCCALLEVDGFLEVDAPLSARAPAEQELETFEATLARRE